jgi:hypothetical protein
MTGVKPRFQFSLVDMLVLTGITVIGIMLFLPGNARSEFKYVSLSTNEILIRSLAVVFVSALSAFLIIWYCSTHKIGGIQRAIMLCCVVPLTWILVFLIFPRQLRHKATAVAASCLSFPEAQELFHRNDHDGDGVLEYSPTIAGLYETIPGTGNLSLLDKTFAAAEGSPGTVTPKAGYVFKVLKSQGAMAKGGAKDYFKAHKNGVMQMTEGYAILAAPAIYGQTGQISAMLNQDGVLYERDLGPDTARIFNEMTTFNPDSTWEEW